MGKVRVENQAQPLNLPTSGHTDIYVDSTTKKLTSVDDQGNVINYGLLSEGIINQVATMNSNVLLTGGVITINIDPTKLNIAAGSAEFADCATNPLSPDLAQITWTEKLAVVNPNIANSGGSFVWIDRNGDISFTVPLDGTDNTRFRDYAFLGVVLHPDRTVHTATNDGITGSPINLSATLTDLNFALGQLNVREGNVYGPAGASLQVYKSAGYLHFTGQNYKSSKKNPNVVAVGEFSPATMTYTYRNGLGGFFTTPTTTNINPGRYDDGTGGTVPTPNGIVGADEWQVMRFYMLPTTTIVHYGQAVFDKKADAIASIDRDIFYKNPELATVKFRGYLVVKGNATNLSDLNQAEFFCADRFGNEVICGGVNKNNDTYQSVYTNSAGGITKVTSGNGAVVVQDADNPISAELFKVNRSGGTEEALSVSSSHIIQAVPATVSADGDLSTSTANIYIDESANIVKMKVKKSTDAVETYNLSLGLAPSYGELYNTTGTVTVTTLGTYYGFTNALAGEVAGTGYVTFTDNATSDRLTVGDNGAGKYKVTIETSFSTSAADDITGHLFVNDSQNTKVKFTRTTSLNAKGSASATGIITLAANQYVDVRFTAGKNGTVITFDVLNLNIIRIA